MAALLVLVLLLVTALVLSLRSVSVRRGILDRVASYLEQEMGIVLRAEDVSFGLGGDIELTGVRLGAPGAPPFVTAERVRIVPDLRSLRREVIVLRSVEVEGPRLDLNAPVPTFKEQPPEPGATPRRIDVLAFRLDHGEVVAAPLEPEMTQWVEGWGARGIAARGSFRGERLDLEAEAAEIEIRQPGIPPQLFRLEAAAAGRLDEPLEVRKLLLSGDGLSLTASGKTALAAEGPFDVRFLLNAEPGKVVPRQVPGGRVHAAGSVAWPANAGQVALQADGLPAEAARPFLPPQQFADLSLAGTVVDVQGDWKWEAGAPERATGPAELTWRRGSRVLARAKARATLEPEGSPLRVAFSGDLLPGSPGRRNFEGTVLTPTWTEVAQAQNQGTTAVLRVPDLGAALAELRTIWPRLVPVPPEGVPARGALEADVKLAGPFTTPTADLTASWVPEPGARVQVKGRAKLPAAEGTARVEIASLPLGSFASGALSGLDGTVSGTADLAGSLRSARTRLDLRADRLAFPLPGSVESVHATADGVLRLDPLLYRGSLAVEGAGLIATANASSTARIASFQLEGDGALDLDQLAYTGPLRLESTGISLEGEPEVQAGRLTLAADGRFSADLRASSGWIELDAREVRAAGETVDAALQARLQDGEVWIPALSVFAEGAEGAGDRAVFGSAHLTLEPLLREADLDLQILRPFEPAVRIAEVSARLRQGVLTLQVPRFEGDVGNATLSATVPLGVLNQFPDLKEAVAGLPLELASGPISVALSAPAVDSQAILAALCLPPRPERLRTGVALGLTLDPQAPATGFGEVRLSGFEAQVETSRIATETGDELVLRLVGGRLQIPSVRLRVDGPGLEGAGVSLAGTADLSPTWNPLRDAPADLVERVAFRGEGTLDAVLLQPFLEGMAASGPLAIVADVSGPPSDLQASLRLSGPEASFFLPGPFATRIEKPEALLTVREDFLEIASGTALVNGGALSLTGGATFGGDVLLKARLAGARYRLPDLYSLSASLSGEVDFAGPYDDRWRLGGSLVVDRGVIDSDINLDQQVLAFLRPQEDAEETDPGILGLIDLDLSFETVDGVRVRNNVGDLRAVWNPLAVRGTLAAPEVYGRIELESGGLVEIYGQTARIDRGALVFSGPPTEPDPDLSVTTALQDPTIGTLRGRSPFDQLDRPRFEKYRDPEEVAKDLGLQEALTQGLAGYYGERVGSRLGRSLGLTLRPVLLFKEEDPTARLTVSRELSANASFALALDLRNAERQTYLLDLYGFRSLPRFTLQGFRNEDDTYGGSLQQTLELGGSPEPETTAPRLRRVRIEAPDTLPRWTRLSLRRAVQLSRGDPVPAAAAFDLEVDLAQALRVRGYPDARVTVTPEPLEKRPKGPERVDLRVQVETGPRVEFEFAGQAPPRAVRASITGLYRTDFYEEPSREDVRQQAVRVFRSLGYPAPQVTVEVRREDPTGTEVPPARTVVIRSEPGRRLKLETVAFEGIAPDAAQALLARRFGSRLARVETAEAVPQADRRLLDDLKSLGYPEARIAGRELAPDGSRLTVRIEPGVRQTIAAITVAGVEGEERRRLELILPVRPGDPFRMDRLNDAAFYLEDSLLGRGFPDAEVVASPLASKDPAGPGQIDVTFQVTPGEGYQLQEVDFEGQRWARESGLRRAAELETGTPLSQAKLNEARDRLFQTGLFTRILPDVQRDPSGQARVAFSLQERARFRLAYGVRWHSEDSASAVVDLVDQNFLGRALTLGLRTLYEPDDRSGRLFLRTGGLLGTRISLESYGELREIRTEDDFGGVLLEERAEAALQLSRPFGEDTTGRVYLRRLENRVREEEPDPFFPLDVKLENTYLGVQSIYDGRNDVLDPTAGTFASLDLSGSGAFLGSDFEYARLFSQLNLYRRVTTWKGRPIVWAQSTRLGLARAFGGQELLRDVRFFAGGEYSVRGYETETLGPEEVLGSFRRPAGGEALVVINEELRFPLLADISGLLFLDLGQIWTDAGDVDTDLAKSLGLGLRARTPVGLLRGDVAFPLDRREGDPGYRFYIGLGNAF